MEIALLTAIGVGGATVIGAGIGFLFKNISHKFSDIVLAFASGVMLAAAVIGLILPAVEYGGGGVTGLLIAIGSMFLGALVITLMDKIVPHLHKLSGMESEAHKENANGTAVIMRYTLRLLAAQQFTRAATLICACEYIRSDSAKGRKAKYPAYDLGNERITIGLWIGGNHTPNRNQGAKECLDELSHTTVKDLKYKKEVNNSAFFCVKFKNEPFRKKYIKQRP